MSTLISGLIMSIAATDTVTNNVYLKPNRSDPMPMAAVAQHFYNNGEPWKKKNKRKMRVK